MLAGASDLDNIILRIHEGNDCNKTGIKIEDNGKLMIFVDKNATRKKASA